MLYLTFNKSNVALSPSVKHLGSTYRVRWVNVIQVIEFFKKIINTLRNRSISLGSISRLFDLTWTMAISFLINLIINHSKGKFESIQYKWSIAITEAIQGTSSERLYKELGLESFSDRCWFRKLTFFIKFSKISFLDISLSLWI